MKIYIPSKDDCVPFRLLRYIYGYKFALIGRGSIPTSRNYILYDALKSKEDVLMIDKDVVPLFELKNFIKSAEDAFSRGYEAYCGLYYLKTLMGLSAGITKARALELGMWPATEIVWLPAPPVEEMQVDVCGTGLLALSYQFLKRISSGYPWFKEQLRGEQFVGEDVSFFLEFRPKTLASRYLANHFLDHARYLSPLGTLEVEGELHESAN
ncbi:MAG: hypothetical protein QW750_06110 [Zestosphaera sp.]